MSFDLILEDAPPTVEVGAERGVSSAFLIDLPSDYKVFLLYFRAGMPNEDLEEQLEKLGEAAGNNLLVNLGSARDPNYDMIVERFGIRKFPVIIMTAVPQLAGVGDEYLTTFVRLDNTYLFDTPERTVKCVEELFQLFIQGKVAEAAAKAKWTERAAAAGAVATAVENALKAVGGILAGLELSFSAVEGKFEFKYKGV
jgi:hypothetical protein